MRHCKFLTAASLLIFSATLSACGGGGATAASETAATPTIPTAPTAPAAPTVPTEPAAPTTPTIPTAPAIPTAPTVPAPLPNFTVAADGSGDFKTLKEAFAAVPDNSAQRIIIHIKPGTYNGQAILTKNKHKVTLQGDSAETTILSFDANVYEQPAGTDNFYKGHGVVIQSNDFKADKVTFQNTSGDHGQAIALRINGDRAVLTNVRLLGWQDTVNLNTGRHYFKNCYIEGRVDFIYGDGTSVFDNCEIKSKNGGYITASNAPTERPFGFVFINSRLTSDPAPWVDPASTVAPKPVTTPAQAFLGRPWRPYAAATFLNCEMGAHIKPAGWDNWGNAANELTARYAEYNSTGPGANPTMRVSWAKTLSKADADKLTIAAILGGSDNWKPE